MADNIAVVNPVPTVPSVPLYRPEVMLGEWDGNRSVAVSPDFFAAKGWLVSVGTLTALAVPEILDRNFWHNGIFYTQAGYGGAYRISLDGISWSTEQPYVRIDDMLVISDTLVATYNSATSKTLYTENGLDWTEINIPTGYLSAVRKVAGTAQTIFAPSIAGHNVAISTDLGLTWTIGALPSKTTTGADSMAYVAGLYSVVNYNDGTGKIYAATSPDGVTWTSRTAALNKSTVYSKLFVIGAVLILHKSNWNEIHRSLDGGATWSTVSVPTYASMMYVVGTRLVATKYDAVNLMYSDDNGATWQNSLTPPDNAKAQNLTFVGDVGVAYFLGAIQVSYNRGYSWVALPKKIVHTPIIGYLPYMQRCDNGLYVHAMTIGAQLVLIESADGVDWVPKGAYININSAAVFSEFYFAEGATYTYHAGTGTAVYIVHTKFEQLYISYNGGVTWTPYTIPNNRQWINNISSMDGKIAVMQQACYVHCGVVTALNTITWTERSGLIFNGFSNSQFLYVHATPGDFVFCHDEWGRQYNQDEIRMDVTTGATVRNPDDFSYKASNRVKIRYNASAVLEASFDGVSWVTYGSSALRSALVAAPVDSDLYFTYAAETPFFVMRNTYYIPNTATLFTNYPAAEATIITGEENSAFRYAPFFSVSGRVMFNGSLYDIKTIAAADPVWRRTDTDGANYDMAAQNGAVISCTDDGINVSQDNGATWGLYSIPDFYPYAVTAGAPGTFVAVGDFKISSGPNVWRAYAAKTTDYGATWALHLMHNGDPYNSPYSVFYNGAVYCAIAGGAGVGLLLSADGETWTQKNDISAIGDANFGYLGCANGSRLFVFGWSTSRYIYSDDNGVTWTALTAADLWQPYVHSFDGDLYIFDDSNLELWRSTDNGLTFTSVLNTYDEPGYYGSWFKQTVAKTDDAFFIFDMDSAAYFTSTDGEMWMKVVNDGRTLDNFGGPSVGSGTRIIRGDKDAPDIEYGLLTSYPFWTDFINCEDV